jgi:hypothetical protein
VADGFLGRWSQRKADVRSGKVLEEPDLVTPPPQPLADAPVPPSPLPPPNLPTLEEAQALGLDSDFKPFAVRGVDPAVRNAAMKKLFSDPQFNVMDRLDIYIDDYSLPSPLSALDLRQMASAKFLKLFDDEVEKADQTPAAVTTPPVSISHVDPDLQLQQDPAAQPASSGKRTE